MFPINKFRFAIAASNQSSPLADSTSLSRLGALHMYFGHLETDEHVIRAMIRRQNAQHHASQQAQIRIQRATQRAIRKMAVSRLQYAASSARLEADIDQCECSLAAAAATAAAAAAADGQFARSLAAQLAHLRTELGLEESRYWSDRQQFCASVRLLDIDWNVARQYLGGWPMLTRDLLPVGPEALRLPAIHEEDEREDEREMRGRMRGATNWRVVVERK